VRKGSMKGGKEELKQHAEKPNGPSNNKKHVKKGTIVKKKLKRKELNEWGQAKGGRGVKREMWSPGSHGNRRGAKTRG